MQQVIALAAPFFGLILLGFVAGKLVRHPPEGLAWLNTFIVYLALPALFFQLIAQTPFEQLKQWSFVITTTTTTSIMFVVSALVGYAFTRSGRAAAIQGAAGAYANVGYMGPGLTLATLGPAATVPTALIFSFDSALMFTLVPLMMSLASGKPMSEWALALQIAGRILLHPFILATLAGVLAAYLQWRPPEAIDTMLTYLRNAAAPCALFAMGVSVALRPIRRIPGELPLLVLFKLVVHPVLALVLLSLVGSFDPVWVKTAIMMAALPPPQRLRACAAIRCLRGAGIQHGARGDRAFRAHADDRHVSRCDGSSPRRSVSLTCPQRATAASLPPAVACGRRGRASSSAAKGAA
ncbi:AEC family transporter [Lutibaculum baratangense]|uniref:AEC family transporter n=1 Tax=Lutibaculum baratangense TaxID=1358440 RepID=UPI002695CABC